MEETTDALPTPTAVGVDVPRDSPGIRCLPDGRSLRLPNADEGRAELERSARAGMGRIGAGTIARFTAFRTAPGAWKAVRLPIVGNRRQQLIDALKRHSMRRKAGRPKQLRLRGRGPERMRPESRRAANPAAGVRRGGSRRSSDSAGTTGNQAACLEKGSRRAGEARRLELACRDGGPGVSFRRLAPRGPRSRPRGRARPRSCPRLTGRWCCPTQWKARTRFRRPPGR